MIDAYKFKNWLQARGVEILPLSNQYELIRFKGKETGILYLSGKTNSEYTNKAMHAFKNNKKWDGAPTSTGRKSNYTKQKKQLIERDGTKCFYCNKTMIDNYFGEEIRNDITVEHLISLTQGGKNTLSNMVLTHEQCNIDAGVLPINEKVKLAIKNRLNE